MPKQNRPLVRDGRIQAKKKRTDRSYLRPNGASAANAPDEALVEEEASVEADSADLAASEATEELTPAVPDAARMRPQPEAPAPVASTTNTAAVAAASPAGRLPTSVRAMQQQGVRKRREFDVHALAIRDSKYALHELRRIAVLAVMVVVTLIVLSFVLR